MMSLLLLSAAAMLRGASQQAEISQPSLSDRGAGVTEPELAEFSFTRLQYDSSGGAQEAYYYYEGRVWERWETDHPQADENFVFRLEELTTLSVNRRSVVMRLTDPEVFEYPMLYLCDVGWMDLSDDEVSALREYLGKGGMLWVDDFWGLGEWKNFERNMERVLPERSWQEVPDDHPLLSAVFPLAGPPQVPARDFAVRGWTHDPPNIHRYPAYGVEQVHLRGWFDDSDRPMVMTTFNTDIGDGWEREGYGEAYFERYSTVAYAMGVNMVVYGLTH